MQIVPYFPIYAFFPSSKGYSTIFYSVVIAGGRCINWPGYINDTQARWKFKSVLNTIVNLILFDIPL